MFQLSLEMEVGWEEFGDNSNTSDRNKMFESKYKSKI